MPFVIDINMPLVLERKGSSFMWYLAYLDEAFIHFGGVNHSKIATMTNLYILMIKKQYKLLLNVMHCTLNFNK